VRLADLLRAASPSPDGRHVLLHASDGYTHAISLEKAMEPTTLVAYRMNGAPLPDRHGYPARVLVPGTYGEVNVKWVDRIEVSQTWRPDAPGTYLLAVRATDGDGQPQTVTEHGAIPAGATGLHRVRVQVVT